MTIKQQGGIFGRNPTFNDLTVEGTLTASGATETSGDLSLNDSKINIIANRPQIFLKEQDRANNNVRLECQNDNFNIAYVDDDNLNNVTRFFVEMNTGDAKIVSGNLIIGTSGKGIDFSATSGTGTSELLDDYERGEWTPVIADAVSGGNTASSYVQQDGSYVKIGSLVTVFGRLANINTSGMTSGNSIFIRGLPFTTTGENFKWLTAGGFEASDMTFSGYLTLRPTGGSSSVFNIMQSVSGSSVSTLTVAAISSGSGDMSFSASYFTTQ